MAAWPPSWPASCCTWPACTPGGGSGTKFLHAFQLGVVVAIAAPVGDLVESKIKRDLGVKDLGTLLPGHGGVLDRFDAFLLGLPAVYYLCLVLNVGI